MSDTSNTTLIGLVESEVLDIVSPLVSAVEDPYWSNLLFSQLGVETDDASTPGIITALQAVLALQTAVSATAQNPEPSFAGVALLLKSAKDVFTSISALSESNGVFAALTGLGDDLVQLLLAYHVATNYPLLYDILVLLTLIQPPEDMTPTAPV